MNAASRLLLIPDLLAYWMTGQMYAEITNASTTGLVSAASDAWDFETMKQLGIRNELFPPLLQPGTTIGTLTPAFAEQAGITPDIEVTSVASHDTASAIVAVPARDEHWAYISCGTWSLLGVELTAPVLSADACRAGFTNERGIDGTTCFLRNIAGLWLLQQSIRTWQSTGLTITTSEAVAAAAASPGLRSIIDVNDPILIPPGDIPARVRSLCASSGQPPPETPAEMVRCILDSLAVAHRESLRRAEALSGTNVGVLHVVGGGARNALLCQLTADACGIEVRAGPIEATSAGNLLIQARTAGLVAGDLEALRRISRRSTAIRRFLPRNSEDWQEAADRVSAPAGSRA